VSASLKGAVLPMKRKNTKTKPTEEPPDLLDRIERLMKNSCGPASTLSNLEELDRAIEAKARGNIIELAEDIFRIEVSFAAKMLCRSLWACEKYMTEWNRSQGHGHLAAPPRALEQEIERVQRIEAHLGGLIETFARSRRVLRLTEESGEVRSAARKLRESLRRLNHPVLPEVAAAAGEADANDPSEKSS